LKEREEAHFTIKNHQKKNENVLMGASGLSRKEDQFRCGLRGKDLQIGRGNMIKAVSTSFRKRTWGVGGQEEKLSLLEKDERSH